MFQYNKQSGYSVVQIAIGVVVIAVFFPFLLSLIVQVPFPDAFGNAITYFAGILWSFDFIFPVAAMFTAFWVVIVMELSFLTIRLAKAIFNVFRNK